MSRPLPAKQRQQTITVCRTVPEVEKRQVVRYQPILTAAADPCAGIVGIVAKLAACVKEEEVTVLREVPEERLVTYTVPVRTLRPETREITVRVPSLREEVRTVKVPETSYRQEVQQYTAHVLVQREEIETYRVPVCEMQPQTETYKVRVPEYRAEVRTKRVPVTTYRLVAEVVTEKVPVSVCVSVPYEKKVWVPVCN